MLVLQAWEEWTEAALGLCICGVNVVPSQIERLILKQPGLNPHYVFELSIYGQLSKYAPMDALTV
jgi:phenylacetate-coenzyme A ligase PaaK-like adenylate-forming protein